MVAVGMVPGERMEAMTPAEIVDKMHDIYTSKRTVPRRVDKPTLVYHPAILMPSGALYPLGNTCFPSDIVKFVSKEEKAAGR